MPMNSSTVKTLLLYTRRGWVRLLLKAMNDSKKQYVLFNVLFAVFIVSPTLVDCQYYCQSLDEPIFGEFPEACGNSVGDRCYVGCLPGFQLIGSCHRTCCSTGEWTGYPSMCINRNIQCPRLDPPDNGRVLSPCLPVAGFVCTFDCGDRVQILGSTTSVCLDNGRWSDGPPSCGSGGTLPTVTPTTNPNIPTELCRDINPPFNGGARGNCVNATVGDRCRFECDTGFTLVGQPEIRCMGTIWDAESPSCQLRICPNMTSTKISIVYGQCQPGIRDQSCIFSCVSGYKIRGQASNQPVVITCREDGTWDSSPRCVEVFCPPLEEKRGPNAPTISPQECKTGLAKVSQRCLYLCPKGSGLTGGPGSTTCLADGTWSGSGTQPRCVTIVCKALVAKDRSLIIAANEAPGGPCTLPLVDFKCTAKCIPGYEPQNKTVLRCQKNGTWDRNLPKCTPRKCDLLVPPADGKIDTNPGSCPRLNLTNCIVRCNPGYLTIDRQQTQTVLCNASRQWDSEVTECIRVYCNPLSAPNYGKASASCLTGFVGETCIMTCDPNYTPSSTLLFCGPTGEWSQTPPVCSPIECPTLMAEDKFGYTSGTCNPGKAGKKCVFSCVSGYGLVGKSDLMCRSDQSWDGPRPRCTRLGCPKSNSIRNGVVYCNVSPCQLKCDTNYRPANGLRFNCTNSIFVGKPKCVRKTCRTLFKLPQNSKTDGCERLNAGNTCYLNCNPGTLLKLDGAIISKGFIAVNCTNQDMWDYIENSVVCEARTCRVQLKSPANGLATGQCSGGDPRFGCAFSCRPGFRLKGPAILRCREGQWDPPTPPTCEKVICPILPLPQPGGYLQGYCAPGTAGDICSFSCPPGLRVYGQSQILCQEDGNWSGDVPSCVPFSVPNPGTRGPRTEEPGSGAPGSYCPSVTVPRGGGLSGTCTPGRPGQQCTVRCPPGYQGSKRIVCRDDGTWSSSPLCSRRSQCPRRRRCCPQMVPPRFGRIMACNLEVGGQCRVACNSGYSPTFRGPMTCMRNRRWNMDMSQIKCNQRLATTANPGFRRRRRTRRRGK